MRRVLPLATVATLLVGFAVWVVVILDDVAGLRRGVEQNVAWISEATEIQAAQAEGVHISEIGRRLGALELELTAKRGPDDEAARLLRAERSTLSGPGRRLDLAPAIAALRADNAAVSRALGERWTQMQIVALGAIVMALSLAALATYLVTSVRPRAARHAAHMATLLAQTEQTLARGRGLGHEVGGAMTAALTTMQVVRTNLRNGRGSPADSVALLDEAIAAVERAGGSLHDARSTGDQGELLAQLRAERRRAEHDLGEGMPERARHRPSDEIRALRITRESSDEGSEPAPLHGEGAPAPVGVAEAAPVSAAAPAAESSTALVTTPLKLLLIDDDAFVLSSVARVLRHDDVTTESDPVRAIEIAVAGSFDVIVCDMMMPGKTGADVYREVVARRPDLAQRFLFMSGGTVEREHTDFLDQAPARIDKPFGAQHLRREVARLAARGGVADGPANDASVARRESRPGGS